MKTITSSDFINGIVAGKLVVVFSLSSDIPGYTLLSCNIQEFIFSTLKYPFIMSSLSLIIPISMNMIWIRIITIIYLLYKISYQNYNRYPRNSRSKMRSLTGKGTDEEVKAIWL
jgi:hypothetical protein